MNKRRLLSIVIASLICCSSCSKSKDDVGTIVEQVMPKKEIVVDLNLTAEVTKTNLPTRWGFEMIEFKGEYWFMGGAFDQLGKRTASFNDIWKSTDGKQWTRVVEHAAWGGRKNFNLFIFENKLWIVGGEDNDFKRPWLNDVWNSEDGITWQQVTSHGPWQKRQLMSVSVHKNKMYLIGGHTLTNWHLYQDVWESTDGVNWKEVSVISDQLLGLTDLRGGIQQHSVVKLNETYYLFGGQISSDFSAFTRVLKSKDMITWEEASITPPWKDFKVLSLNNLRPLEYKGNLIFIAAKELVKSSLQVPIVYSSQNGEDWNEEIQLPASYIVSNLKPIFMDKPRSLIVEDKIYLYGSSTLALLHPSLDKGVSLIELTNK